MYIVYQNEHHPATHPQENPIRAEGLTVEGHEPAAHLLFHVCNHTRNARSKALLWCRKLKKNHPPGNDCPVCQRRTSERTVFIFRVVSLVVSRPYTHEQ